MDDDDKLAEWHFSRQNAMLLIAAKKKKNKKKNRMRKKIKSAQNQPQQKRANQI